MCFYVVDIGLYYRTRPSFAVGFFSINITGKKFYNKTYRREQKLNFIFCDDDVSKIMLSYLNRY